MANRKIYWTFAYTTMQRTIDLLLNSSSLVSMNIRRASGVLFLQSWVS